MKNDKLYELTDEHRAQLPGWADRWIANALSTKSMDDEDRAAMQVAVKGLYEAADLKAPAPDRIVFVDSPFIAAFASGLAAWAVEKGGTIRGDSVIHRAARQAAGQSETVELGGLDGKSAAALATAESDPHHLKWFNALDYKAQVLASGGLPAKEMASESWRMRDGGNQWSGWSAYLSFFRHVAKLDLDYSKWQHYESAAIHGGPRYMHEDFCIVSDRPTTLTMDDDNEPHNEDGPFCTWRDGTKLYSVNGHRVPGWVVEDKSSITIEAIAKEENAETRRIMREFFGEGRYLQETGAELLHVDTVPIDALEPRGKHITRALMKDSEDQRWLVGSDGSTPRVYYMRVTESVETCEQAYNELRSLNDTNLTTILQS